MLNEFATRGAGVCVWKCVCVEVGVGVYGALSMLSLSSFRCVALSVLAKLKSTICCLIDFDKSLLEQQQSSSRAAGSAATGNDNGSLQRPPSLPPLATPSWPDFISVSVSAQWVTVCAPTNMHECAAICVCMSVCV